MINMKSIVFLGILVAACSSETTNAGIFGSGGSDAGGAGGEAGMGTGGAAGTAADADADVDAVSDACTPGEQRSCICDSASGEQVCGSDGVFGVCKNSGMCCGAPGGWHGCEGNGCAVCSDLVKAYPNYFKLHPSCIPQLSCGTSYGVCSAVCPSPTNADL